MSVTFLGAAQEVTGSCILVEHTGVRFLVDCGMFQGDRETRRRNFTAWTFDPEDIDFVLLTHAHIDHSGLLPRLCALGFSGPIVTTRATADLLSVMLLDSAYIQEADWARDERKAGRQRARRRAGRAGPLYTVAQAEACLKQIRPVAYDDDTQPGTGVRCRFRDAGHILGSAILELWLGDGADAMKLVFAGDLGQPSRPLLRDPTRIESTDILVVESTYANRLHRPLEETVDELVSVVGETLRQLKGNIIIPAFAVGRTQEILYLLVDLCRKGRLPPMDIFVDSPMAAKASAITRKHMGLLDDEARELLAGAGEHEGWPRVRFTQSVEEARALNQIKAGAVIVSASGMCDAGRIKHHLRHNLGRAECAIVIVGYQALGTLGRRLVDGEKRVRIFGVDVPVRASIHTIGGLSAHADADALSAWLHGFTAPPKRTFVVHGEREVATGFATRLAATLNWRVDAPEIGIRVEL